MSFNEQIIDTFRANDGVVMEPVAFGKSLVLVHVPRKDGSTRVVPLGSVLEDGAWYVVAAGAGSPTHPVWVYGLRRASSVDIEVAGTPVETVHVRVEELGGDERERIWQRFTKRSPAFEQYRERAEGRVFPIFRFSRA